MQDIINKYKKHKIVNNVNIILASLVIAFWINFMIYDTNIWESLKTSVLNSEINEAKSDISITKQWEFLFLVTNKQTNNVKNLSLSLTYNPENIEISEIKSDLWDVVNLSNTPWISSIILSSDKELNLNPWDKIIKISATKKEEKSENLNIINANFKDSNDEIFLLSTSWITF